MFTIGLFGAKYILRFFWTPLLRVTAEPSVVPALNEFAGNVIAGIVRPTKSYDVKYTETGTLPVFCTVITGIPAALEIPGAAVGNAIELVVF